MSIFYTIILLFKIIFGLSGFENEVEYKNIQLFYNDDIAKIEANRTIRIIYKYYAADDKNINSEFTFQLIKDGNLYKFNIPVNDEYYTFTEDEIEEFNKYNQLLVEEISEKIFNGDLVYYNIYDSYFNEIDEITIGDDQRKSKSLLDYIPTGYKLNQEIYGDLNKDGFDDCILIIEKTSDNFKHFNNESMKRDLNRRGVLIFLENGKKLKNEKNYLLINYNYDCFLPQYGEESIIHHEHYSNGVILALYPPELKVSIKNGNIILKWSEGFNGDAKFKEFNFRYNKLINEFELIGFDCNLESDIRIGWFFDSYIYNDELSINYLTKKLNYKKTIGIDENAELIHDDLWFNIKYESMITFSDINKFDDLDIFGLHEYFHIEDNGGEDFNFIEHKLKNDYY